MRKFGFEPNRLTGANGFTRIAALRDAVDALYTSDETKRRFEIMARELFSRMKTLILEPSVRPYYLRHDLTISMDLILKLPPLIAIAVENGGKNGDRGLEYDTMSDRLAVSLTTKCCLRCSPTPR